jgi:cellulose synthase/poly-beta-1,6-N-acetylglucosamine synthase-like glycosyltransferase
LTIFLQALLGCAALLLTVPAAVLFAEVLLAVTRRGAETPAAAARPRLAVLMPAHNEASVIAPAIRSVLAQLSPADRLLVIADNCSDPTAAIALTAGAQVIERTDPIRRGKGYALDFGVQHLRADAPQVAIVIDADCEPAAGALDRLARVCIQSGRPVQALYLMQGAADAGVAARLAQFAWIVKNQVRPLGLRSVGLPCHLFGTGMAFPWSALTAAALASGHIVEDLKLGIDLARAGTPALFCPEALVTSFFPTSSAGVMAQRTRWEHGHLGVILSEAPRLFVDSVARLRPRLLALALDLSVPPLALLALLLGVVWFSCIALYYLTNVAAPLRIASVALAMLVLAVFLAWARYGRRVVSLGDLAFAGVYAVLKVPVYAKFLIARQLEWVRSRRDGDRS